MKRQIIAAIPSLLFCGLLALPGELPAQVSRSNITSSGVVSPLAAGRLGLERVWFTQIQMDRSRARVEYINQHVSTKKFYTVFEVQLPDGKKIYFSERHTDRFGDLLGVEGAKKAAEEKVRDLMGEKIKATLVKREIPDVLLLVQTDHGTLQAIDGETGRTLWVSSVGNEDYPSLEAAANDDFVATINGSTLYILDRKTGKEVWTRRLASQPGAGPAVTDDRVMVPLVDGKMESFMLDDPAHPPWRYQSTGRLMVQPSVATNSFCWCTDRGYMYVAQKEKEGVRFRLEARDAIVVPAVALAPNRVFAASIDGFVYCVHEFNGQILWRFSIGDPVYEPIIVAQKSLYAVAEGSGLFRINVDTGLDEWRVPHINKLLGVSKTRVYCIDRVGQLVVLDAATGGRINAMPLTNINFFVNNAQTDRLFLGTKEGVIQCLKEVDSDWPLVHAKPESESAAKPEVVQKKVEDKPVDKPAEPEDDPFGGGAPADDPFGGGGAGGAADDPFGGGGDAGGKADDAPPAEDPFGAGGGEDPFG